MAGGGIFIDGNLGYPLLESHIVAGWHNFSYFFFIARSLSRLDSNVTVWVATQNHTRTRLSVLFVNWCLCEKLSVYLYTPCCYTARQLSFNLGSSLPSQLTLLLEDQSIPRRNGRDQSQNCSMSVLEAEKISMVFSLSPCPCTALALFFLAEWRRRWNSGRLTSLNCLYCLDAATSY